MSRYFNRKGQSITCGEWVARSDEKFVKATNLGDAGEVSTVWLGLDHRFGNGPRQIFETLVFGGALDQEMYRYATEDEALAGHDAMVKRIQAEREQLYRIAAKPEVQEAVRLLAAVGVTAETYERYVDATKKEA